MPMIVNTAWLLEYLEGSCSHEDLLDALPRLGLEIEQRHELRSALEAVRIGFVREKAPSGRGNWPVVAAGSWSAAPAGAKVLNYNRLAD